MQYTHLFSALERVSEERALANSRLSPDYERPATPGSRVLEQPLDRGTFRFTPEQHRLTLSRCPQPGNKNAGAEPGFPANPVSPDEIRGFPEASAGRSAQCSSLGGASSAIPETSPTTSPA